MVNRKIKHKDEYYFRVRLRRRNKDINELKTGYQFINI